MQLPEDRDITQARSLLRREALARRDAIPEDDRRRLSETICETVFRDLERANARFIHCYISFRSEVQTRRLIERFIASGIRVVTPVVDVAAGPRALVHTEITHLNDLKSGSFGLEEPSLRGPAALEGLDAVIVPIVAFDRRGSRLGYGKGFYDAFLGGLPSETKRIGLAFALQEVTHIPLLPHDIAVGRIITESEDIIIS